MSGEEFISRLAGTIGCRWSLEEVWCSTYRLRFYSKEDCSREYLLLLDGSCQICPTFSTLKRMSTASASAVLQSLTGKITRGEDFSILYALDCHSGRRQILAHSGQPLEAVLVEAMLNFTGSREQDNGQQQTSRAS